MFVYQIYNNITGKYYVGRTVQSDLSKYLKYGKMRQARLGEFNGMPIVKSIAKHGWNNFDVQVLAEIQNYDQLCELERLWIILLNAKDKTIGYNICPGGKDGRKGLIVTAVTKAKMSAAHTGRVRTQEHRQNIRNAKKQLYKEGRLRGLKPPAEALANLSSEQKAARDIKRKATWAAKSIEEKVACTQSCHIANKAFWSNCTPEQREDRARLVREGKARSKELKLC